MSGRARWLDWIEAHPAAALALCKASCALVAKLANAPALHAGDRKVVRVRSPARAHFSIVGLNDQEIDQAQESQETRAKGRTAAHHGGSQNRP